MKTTYTCLYDKLLVNKRTLYKGRQYYISFDGEHWNTKQPYCTISTIDGYFVGCITEAAADYLFTNDRIINEVDDLFDKYFFK